MLRMKDLCERTGLSRQAIHFYVSQGLVDPPKKKNRTMGYYTEAHVERILLVRKLQEQHFLPLKAIRAMLDDKRGPFTAAQRRVLAEVRSRLPPAIAATPRAPESVPLEPILRRTRVSDRDLKTLVSLRLVEVAGKGAKRTITRDDAWVLELWADVRAAGFTADLGFGPDVLMLFEEGVAKIFQKEKKILASLATRVPPDKLAEMVERALPLVHAFLVRAHERKVRELFLSLPEPTT